MKTATDEGIATAATGAAPAVRFRDPQIEMAHGAGGKASRRLVEGLFVPLFGGAAGALRGPLADAAHLEVDGARLAFTADSFVVRPLRFPGGSIGEARTAVRVSTTVWLTPGSVSSIPSAAAVAAKAGTPGVTS